MTLDPKGLEAAATAMRAECPGIPVMDISEPFLEMMLDKAITAYLAAVPSDVAGLVERLLAGPDVRELEDGSRAWEMDPDATGATMREAATALSALSARPHPNETLEWAAKSLEAKGGVFMRDAAAVVRKMKEPE